MTPLAQKTYDALATVPAGKVTTYKHLAHAAGTTAYRAIGQFMRANPFAPQVPCHRVVASDGSLGGFQGQTQGEALEHKIALLKSEGVVVAKGKVVNFKQHLFTF